ncbi:putative glycolipid-binding domain-containing protein [Xanthovirga aplysinae]|uniref:putative glycolipid-binding domain-containing protein n=1 Tax=Xanthovirga aplysinae TaxID=2529853 RepID=UPI0012BD21CA|nr:putative glycolipid-binding domain-containing protein [Xanthovirga aplysinae]MTI33520.1 transcriptional regulator [Xanthovirga aplysinae]
METSVIWQALKWKSTEYLTLDIQEDLIKINSRVVGVKDGNPFDIAYQICCDKNWNTRSFEINTREGKNYFFQVSESGKWFDLNGNTHSHLEGCLDIDISLSPFTNTLPINRLNLKEGERKEIDVLFIELPTFKLRKVKQAYTFFKDRNFKYEGISSNFETNLPIDDLGLVTNYPGLFERIWTVEK